MATKPAAKAAPVKPSTSRALQPWEAQMAAAATKQAAVEKPMGLFKQIVIKSATIMIDDKPVPGNRLNIVALASCHENQYFDKPYNPAVPAVPACYAFATPDMEDPETEMKPGDDVDEQQGYPLDKDGELDKSDGEGPACHKCWANRMGTADTGKGKACQNVRRMIVTTEDALESPEKMKDAEARSLKVPVMSVKNWVKFVHEIEEEVKRPPYGVVAELGAVPDDKSQWQVLFKFQELITFTQPLWEALQKRVKAAEAELRAPYPKLEDQPAAPTRGGRGAPAVPTGRRTAGAAARPGVAPAAKKQAARSKF